MKQKPTLSNRSPFLWATRFFLIMQTLSISTVSKSIVLLRQNLQMHLWITIKLKLWLGCKFGHRLIIPLGANHPTTTTMSKKYLRLF